MTDVAPTGHRGPAHARTPRTLHPIAWWLWALGLATAASRTTNPLLLALVLGVLALVVASRRTEAPWARAFKYYLYLAMSVVALRVLFRSVFGGDIDPQTMHVLFRLPQVPLPSWAAGVQLGGPVTLEGTMAAVYDGLRLGTLLCCLGAANALANPKRALQGPARRAVRTRGGRGGLAQRGPPARGECPARPAGPEAPGRPDPWAPRPPGDRHPGPRGRLRPFVAVGGGDGLPRLRTYRGRLPTCPSGHRRPHARPACSGSARAPTDCSTARPRGRSGSRPWRPVPPCAAPDWSSAVDGCGARQYRPDPWRWPSGRWWSAGWCRPWCSWPRSAPGRTPSIRRPTRWRGRRFRPSRPSPSWWRPSPRWCPPRRSDPARPTGRPPVAERRAAPAACVRSGVAP